MLKPDRNLTQWVFNYKAGAVGEMGGLVSSSTPASGVGANGPATASYLANPSGAFVLGVQLDNVIVLDERIDRNRYKESVAVGDQVSIGSEGWVVTDRVYPGVTPVAGTSAYLGASGYFTNVQASGAPKVGRFETSKDESGFVKVSLNIPL